MKFAITLLIFSSLSIYAGEGSSGGGPKLTAKTINLDQFINNDIKLPKSIKEIENKLLLGPGGGGKHVNHIDKYIQISKKNISDLLLKNGTIIHSDELLGSDSLTIKPSDNVADIQLIDGRIIKLD